MKKIAIMLIVLMLVGIGFLSGCTTPSEAKDTDGDGHPDSTDAFPDNPNEWLDSDKDGIGDNSDAFPQDAGETKDSDKDGVGDNSDAYPNNPYEQYDSDNDGVGNNADKFPYDSTQSSDRDGDGYGDNPNGNNADLYPNDPKEWKDTDHDGIGDNADIYDSGNGRIKVQITKFIGDNYAEGWPEGGTNDPFFKISIYAYYPDKQVELAGEGQSDVYADQVNIDYPFSLVCDVDDDANKIMFIIEVIDEGYTFASDTTIDVNSDIQAFTTGQDYFPGINNNIQSFTDDGKTDLQDERDGYIEYSIQVVGV